MLRKLSVLWMIIVMLGLVGTYRAAGAALLTLSWADNSDNESGFDIERKTGTAGTYQALASVGSDVTSYTDSNLSSGTTYCYRVHAFNSAGVSTYSNETCSTTAAATFTLSLSRAGTGSGTITSSPAGLSCGSTCSSSFASGTAVALTATPAAGSIFAGWSGAADCSDGSVTVNGNLSCTATFNVVTYSLTVAKAGTGSGSVTSSPAGINCGSACSATLNSGTAVTLTATPASGSVFAGWSGTGCSSGSVTLNANTACTATFNVQTFALTVAKSGTGSGTVTSSPAGINCGSACSATLNSGTVVALTATAASGSVFAGWSGAADCSDGGVTVNGNVGCTARFNLVPQYTLTTSILNQITSSGSASGSIISSPAGIDCGNGCTATYASGTIVNLTPVAAANSAFSGWSGDSDCDDGSVTMNANKTCTANFSVNLVTLSISKTGNGTVVSTPSGISCGAACSYSFVAGSSVTLRATPASGFIFSGWTGACTGTSDCTITLSGNMTAIANFYNALTDKIGVYRPSTGEWFLDRNGNEGWDGCGADLCLHPIFETSGTSAVGDWSGSGAIYQASSGTAATGSPVVGDWNGSGVTKVGWFVSASSEWFLDANGNGIWDGCGVDTCINSFGQATDLPVVGQWSAAHDDIGIFRFGENKWHLNSNSDGDLDRCTIDKCPALSVYQSGDVPVSGDWTGRGSTQMGLFRPSMGQWFLDGNANRAWNGCSKDLCISSFGMSGDVPVTGDWAGNGVSKIGVFRPSTGEWFLDLNGNGKWDGASLDLYVPGYGQAGDVPVVGRW